MIYLTQAYNVPDLVHMDKIIHTVTYSVNGFEVNKVVYTWTLLIPTPELIDVVYSPGEGVPAFQATAFDYNLTLDPGARETSVELTKQPGDIRTDVVKRRFEVDETVCSDCNYATPETPEVSEHLNACARHLDYSLNIHTKPLNSLTIP